jgi:hypothetical protein
MNIYFETKSTVQMERYFWHQFDVLTHGRIPFCNDILKRIDDFNVRGSEENKYVGLNCIPKKAEQVMQQDPSRSAKQQAVIYV